jgi:hypothetical protein
MEPLLKEVAKIPFQSDKQKRFLYAKHPDIAKRWSEEEKGLSKAKMKKAAKRRLKKGKK